MFLLLQKASWIHNDRSHIEFCFESNLEGWKRKITKKQGFYYPFGPPWLWRIDAPWFFWNVFFRFVFAFPFHSLLFSLFTFSLFTFLYTTYSFHLFRQTSHSFFTSPTHFFFLTSLIHWSSFYRSLIITSHPRSSARTLALLLTVSPSPTLLLIDTITMVQKPADRNSLPAGNSSDNSSIVLTMPDIVEDYTETEIPPLVVLPETLSPPSTLPPSPPPAPPSALLSSSHSLRHHPYLTITKASRQSLHRGHSPATFLQNVAPPPLVVVHPSHVPAAGLLYCHVPKRASILAPPTAERS